MGIINLEEAEKRDCIPYGLQSLFPCLSSAPFREEVRIGSLKDSSFGFVFWGTRVQRDNICAIQKDVVRRLKVKQVEWTSNFLQLHVRVKKVLAESRLVTMFKLPFRSKMVTNWDDGRTHSFLHVCEPFDYVSPKFCLENGMGDPRGFSCHSSSSPSIPVPVQQVRGCTKAAGVRVPTILLSVPHLEQPIN